MIRRPPRSTPLYSSAASDVYKRQGSAFLPSSGSVNGQFNASATGVIRLSGQGSLTGSYNGSASASSFIPAQANLSGTFSASATGAILIPGKANLSASVQLRAVGNAFLPAQGAIYTTFSASGVGRVFPFTEPGSVTGDFKTASLCGSYKVCLLYTSPSPRD